MLEKVRPEKYIWPQQLTCSLLPLEGEQPIS
jgi:hypothetical protein